MKVPFLLPALLFSTTLAAQIGDDAMLAELSNTIQTDRPALSAFDLAVLKAPNSAAPWYDRAEDRVAKGDTEGAMKDLDRALRLEPLDTYAMLLRAQIHKQNGDDRMATNDLYRIVGLGPKAPVAEEAMLELGRIAMDRNELPSALDHFSRLVNIAPYNALAWCERGRAYAALLNDESAINDLRKALDLDPELDQAYANLAAIYFRQGRKQEGCFALHQAHDLGDRSVERLLLVHCE